MIKKRNILSIVLLAILSGCSSPEMLVLKPETFLVQPRVSSSQSQGLSSIQIAKQKVASDPSNWRNLNELGLAYYAARSYQEAIAAFEQALALHPVTTAIEAENKQQAAIDAQHSAALQNQKRMQEAQNSAAMGQLFSGLIGSVASMPGVDPNAMSFVQNLNVAMSAAAPADTSMSSIPRQVLESQLKPKRELSEIYFNLGMSQFAKGIYSDSILSLENSFSLDPTRSDALKWEAEACYRQASYQKAIVLMNRYLAIGAENPEPSVYERLSSAFRSLELSKDADKAFQAAVEEHQKLIAADSTGMDAKQDLARAYMSQDLCSDAEIVYSEILAVNDSDDVRLELATAQLCMLHYEDALKSINKVLGGRGASQPYPWYLAGRLYDETGRISEASNAYAKADELIGRLQSSAEKPSYMLVVMAARGRYAEARKEMDDRLAGDSYGADAYSDLYRLGLICEKGGDDVIAMEAFSQACSLRPRYLLPKAGMARLEKKNSAECSKLLGAADAEEVNGNKAGAVKALTKAYQLMAAGQKKQEVLKKILRLSAGMETPLPMTPDSQRYYLRGNAALKAAKTPADLDRAIFEFKWASVLAPWSAPAYLNASVAYGVRQRYGEAIENLKIFLTVNPNSKNVDEVLSKLAELEFQQENSLRSLSFQRAIR